MKRLLFITIIVSSHVALADEYVRGYYRQNGSYVQPHYQTPPDNNMYNNYSTRGNVNPYTGQQGYISPYQQYPTYRSVQPYGNAAPNTGYYR